MKNSVKILLCIFLLFVLVQTVQATETYQFVTKWGTQGSGNGQFFGPWGVAVDTAGNVYIADSNNHRVQKFSQTGIFLKSWGMSGQGDSQFDHPYNIVVDPSGNVLVTDTDNQRIQKFTSDGTFITKWGTQGSGDGQFNIPTGMAVDNTGNVYVTDSWNHRIQKFSSTGTFLAKWGSYGTGDGQFSTPNGVAVDSSGNVYVTDGNNNRVQKFSSDGTFITKWGSKGSGDGQFYLSRSGIIVDPQGGVYVADSFNNRIQKFTSDGTFITKWGTQGSGDGQFNYPTGITIDNTGNVYVLDSDNNRIQKFAPSATPPVASFTGSPVSGTAPLTVSFTDTSTGTPTGWAWFFGDETYTQAWTRVTASASWAARKGHSSVVMPDGSIVLMGGDGLALSQKNDVWRSTDNGATWTQQTANAGWSARKYHSSVAMPDGSIVLMGGALGETGPYKNDVWRSTDNGATWTQQTANAGWSARCRHTSVVLPDGSIILMGGGSSSGFKNDVWRSTDKGVTWTQQTANAAWSPRASHSSVAMPDGSLVLMGSYDGSAKNDVWRSTDKGVTWTQQTANAAWQARGLHSSVVMPDGSIVLMGGWTGLGNGEEKNDMWRSTDSGATWTQLPNAGWSIRREHSSVAMPDGSIVLMGGFYNRVGWYNDVWRFVPTGSSAQNPSHTYTNVGTYTVSLTATNSGGSNTVTKTNYITVKNINNAPVLKPIGAKTVDENQILSFVISASDPDGNTLTYTTSTLPAGAAFDTSTKTFTWTPTYDQSGTYTVTFTVTDGYLSDSKEVSITVNNVNRAPVADAGLDQVLHTIGSIVTLDGTKSYDIDGDPLTYQWSFALVPAGSTAILSGATTSAPTFKVDKNGEYRVQLIVSDSNSATSAPAIVTLSFANIKPVAEAGTSRSVVVGEKIILDGTQSSDANGDPLTYRWSVLSAPAGSTAHIANPAGATTSFVPDKAGSYSIQLIVNDGIVDSDASSFQIEVVTTKTKIISDLQNLQTAISSLPLNGVKNRNMPKTLNNKLNEIIRDVQSGDYKNALKKLQNDVLAKMDGCAANNVPDKNDWLTTCSAQSGIYQQALSIITELHAAVVANDIKVTQDLQKIQTTISALPPDAIKNDKMRDLNNKLNEIIRKVQSGNSDDAIKKLQTDILEKTDGCAAKGVPDKNDWITTCNAQASIYPQILSTINQLQTL